MHHRQPINDKASHSSVPFQNNGISLYKNELNYYLSSSLEKSGQCRITQCTHVRLKDCLLHFFRCSSNVDFQLFIIVLRG